MQGYYPRMVDSETKNMPARRVRVETPEDHVRIAPHDFAMLQEEIANQGITAVAAASAVDQAVLEERQRCAKIAQYFPEAGTIGRKIAAAIRGGGFAPEEPKQQPAKAAKGDKSEPKAEETAEPELAGPATK